jgi:hypothetical protein
MPLPPLPYYAFYCIIAKKKKCKGTVAFALTSL